MTYRQGTPYRAPVRVGLWMDVFTFLGGGAELECPDCDTVSPPLRDLWAAAQWVHVHLSRDCPAIGRPS